LLDGSVSSKISNWKDLMVLALSDNNFTGSIPVQIGSITKLMFLDLSKNQLTGINGAISYWQFNRTVLP
jgi:Leucine-rich repeat (LRR) protein